MTTDKIRPGWLVLVATSLAIVTSGAPIAAQDAESQVPELTGRLSRQEIESAVPDWVEQEIVSSPDLEAATELIPLLRGADITVFFGTWCSDSKRELSRLWRAMDELAVVDSPGLVYIGVDRSKIEPREYVDGVDLLFVPTFIVSRDGEELGRVVEESPLGIEADLLAILRGTKTGLVTAKTELLEDRPAER